MYKLCAEVKVTSIILSVMTARSAPAFCHSCFFPGQGRVDLRYGSHSFCLYVHLYEYSALMSKVLRDLKHLEGFFSSHHSHCHYHAEQESTYLCMYLWRIAQLCRSPPTHPEGHSKSWEWQSFFCCVDTYRPDVTLLALCVLKGLVSFPALLAIGQPTVATLLSIT